MRKISQFLLLPLLALLMLGCASTITNLTVSKQPRNPSGMYPVEVAWDTQQQTIRPQSLTAYVVVDLEQYRMRPTRGIDNRWETVIPVPPDKKVVTYHFKVDYEYNRMGKPQKSSKLSQGHRLEIIDK